MGARSVHQLYPSKSFIQGPFEVASFEHIGLERPFNMAAMTVFTLKCPSESNISRLKRTVGLDWSEVYVRYMLAGQIKERWCRDQGWDGRDPVCEVVKCEAPPTIENGQLDEEPKDNYDYSQVVSYKCNSGLSLIGSSTLLCSEDGTFKPDPPKCSDGCPKPEILHATRIGGKSPPYKLGNFIDYKCEDGYTMKGDYHIVCSAEGWNPDPPKCIGPCGKPVFEGHVILTAEFRSKTIFPLGSKVTVECMTGYEPVDSTVSKSVTCEETNWTELLLTCKVVECKAPPTIENGQLDEEPQDSYDYSQVVYYKCNSGFTLTGSPKLNCSEDGTFKPEPPNCLGIIVGSVFGVLGKSQSG
ncbi:Complement component receptor 1-like protein [Anabarilius grahami]|uniref:Complement component receptor 1-like protein n=1 Tax=Anabarilius grahami TaxID=495550 RepID=A0A3N0YL44_ANAGA|nr:Complement component receptor 1-like protein [Anabarilius grahami]